MENLRCVVERTVFQNPDNGYSVLRCRAKGFSELVTVVGSMPEMHVGTVLSVGGTWKVNPKFGRQFEVETFEETLPATVYGIEKYLGSGLIKGVGPKYAKKIVVCFGKDTLKVIDETPERLIEVPGIGQQRVTRIQESWKEQKDIKNIMIFLQGHDVSTALATKIYRAYGNDSIATVQENPYRMADEIVGIGFRTADTVARKMGFGDERYVRLRSGILYALNQLAGNGHCFGTKEQVFATASDLLQVDESLVVMTLDEMVRQQDVLVEKAEICAEPGSEEKAEPRVEEAVYLRPFYFSEEGVAGRLVAILNGRSTFAPDPEGVLERVQKETGIEYEEIQKEAIVSALRNKVMILTGGPGTGKTTTTLGIISACRAAGASVLLAAPTGRAARRMSEATGMEAKTIHRLLDYKIPDGFQRNAENPLEGDVLIVDECSMIDLVLMYNLLKAVPDTMRIVFVGDVDQLPSVGAGNVLADMIASGCIPVVRLEHVFRQAGGSRIIQNAHRINKGLPIDVSGGTDSDFFFSAKATQEDTVETVIRYVKESLPRYYHVNPVRDIQVLTPMQVGTAGAVNLNHRLQEALNGNSLHLSRGGTEYRLYDKVMQIRNDYLKEVYNGDIGYITHVNTEDRELTVSFDGREVVYDVSELDELVLAYACTIHKSQGSEYPIVVMPIVSAHHVMLQRNLLYTGVTRAKKILVLVGEKRAVSYAIGNSNAGQRNTRLSGRIARLAAQEKG